MGFFSFHTNDTNEPIYNAHQDVVPCRPVFLMLPTGETHLETSYNGYGVFGGYDYFAVIAVLNRPDLCWDDLRTLPGDDLQALRLIGIDMAFNEDKYTGLLWPNLIHNPHGYVWRNEKPRDHRGQGFWE
jgi:hypothetical protein